MSITRKIMIIVASISVVTIGSLTAYNLINFNMTQTIRGDAGELHGRIDTEKPNTIKEIKTESIDEEIDRVMERALAGSTKATQKDVISLMHAMTHQKVISNDKLNSVQMTPERIKQLINILESEGTVEWDHYSELMEIASKWRAGDFLKIDEDHNYLCELESSNHVEAVAVATPEQEKEFIKKTWGEPSIQE
ncbi:DUF6241 domain-containing protein [Paenibacillus gallinarum]|uniref:Uncharacterized protein n=1 Tax=Paenibacillus gallinarum TaxID=2762232 RepID=A0ABR8T3P3_9BACL|nr:DUF6241 domain-containing protein [Paenibacillus gallinarum]MBD7970402.1 hypothetical protein [Paenibacillus gallinarum]